MIMDQEKIGNFICELRKEQNRTQKELAQKLNVTNKAVSKWERGLSLPSIDLLTPLSRELGISVMELLEGERRETDSIDLTSADAILEQTIGRLRKTIRRKRLILLVTFLLLLLCTRISGALLWNQGLLLDERGVNMAQLYYNQGDPMLDWLRFFLLLILLGISGISFLRKE